MENIVEGFCGSRDYKSVSKKLKAAISLSNNQMNKFVDYMKKNRSKRKSTALSFEVSLVLSYDLVFK